MSLYRQSASTTKSQYQSRPTFFIRNFPIRAAGVLFYRRGREEVEFLFMRRHALSSNLNVSSNLNEDWLYEDFGGKTESVDTTIIDTAAREVDEESNHAFAKDWLREQLLLAKWRGNYFINGRCKYIVFIVPAPEDLDIESFGNVENGTPYQREVVWVSHTQVKDLPLHPRLRTPYLSCGLRKAS
jgi:8-oxo-dGTP pyrophosphatase MutT (NUDIX family)